MQNPFVCGVGGVVSADIAVPEHEREVAFYTKVLTTGAEPLWRDDLMNNRGTPIIGLGARVPEYESLPLQWMPHFQVADVATCVDHATALGATELMHGKDENGESLWAGLLDPAGAGFGVIPAVDDAAYHVQPSDRVGRISGLTLVTQDASTLLPFYERVIGWSASPADDHGRCAMRRSDGVAAAVIRTSGADFDGVPGAWLLHLPVGDLAASLEHVRSEGGAVVREASVEGFAVVRDPVGVHFALEGCA